MNRSLLIASLFLTLSCSLERNRDFVVDLELHRQGECMRLTATNDGLSIRASWTDSTLAGCSASFDEDQAAAFHTLLAGLRYDTVRTVVPDTTRAYFQTTIHGDVVPHRVLVFQDLGGHPVMDALLNRTFSELGQSCMRQFLSGGGRWFPMPTRSGL